ncbi:polysaccharide biosynthesis protein [Reinekea sp. G2M2-21]|uniref:polysaccharide biosynthesis protein n=1 Tax=Reinekea sp. G2M2-21 TaxID=2788942 RepID=UPI0018AA1CB2|nr:polysaccharide biosynthesis protein [Reinekea sp. G2M2-21]
MAQSKLFKAFERERAKRELDASNPSATPDRDAYTAPTKEESASKVISDLVPSSTIMDRNAILSEMRNPNPMSIADMRRKKLVYSGMKNRSVLNAYRELRIKLIDLSESQNITVLLSSVDAKDNSIVTAMNLAISFSLDVSSSALLVDCNPYGTELQSLVTSKFEAGITDFVQDDNLSLESIIYPSGIERVNVIPAGNNPAAAVEMFSSKAMQNLVYELKNRYSDRFIVINAPPVLSSSEARVLTRYCDHTVLTVPYGTASVDKIEESVDAIGAANVTGVVYQQ